MESEIFSKESLSKLDYETPFFLFSKEKIINKVEEFKSNFPDAKIHYAMKANFEESVIKIIDNAGVGFEIASKYELAILQRLNISPEKIIYGTSIKPADHIKVAYDYGVRIFACDCLPELEKIARLAPGSNVYFRLHVDNKKSVFDLSEKFGTHKEDICDLIRSARELNLVPYGISFHVGSQSKDSESWANNLDRVKKIIDHVEVDGISLEVINIGGGYPCTYISSDSDITLKEISDALYKRMSKLGIKQNIIMEPGRGMIANSAVAVATIIGKAKRSDTNWLFLDLGVYNGLFEVMAYQGSTRYRCESLTKDGSDVSRFALSGPTGDGPDVIDRDVELPSNIDVGDKVVIYDVGAYSLVATSPFNGFPKPCVHII